MTKDEFIKNCTSLGYCDKKRAEEYCEGRDVLTEDDYIAVYRKSNSTEGNKEGSHLFYCGNGGRTTKRWCKYTDHSG